MAIQVINIGTVANDGSGDDLREAFNKANQNFAELDGRIVEATTASNLGSSGEGIFAQRVGADLQFKKLIAGAGTTFVATDNGITISSTATGLNDITIIADTGNSTVNDTASTLTIAGGANVTTTVTDNSVTIASQTVLQTDSNPRLGNNLDTAGFNITGSGDARITVWGVDMREVDGIQSFVKGFDFGDVNKVATNFIEFIEATTNVDFGTIVSPSALTVDLGEI